MAQIRKDIQEVQEFILEHKGKDECFDKYSSTFLFGTENQDGINSILGYDGKSVLTVASSGDQYLSAVYYGASKVDIYDVNRFAYYVTYLKIAAVMTLSYGEFLNFMVPSFIDGEINKSFWNMETLQKLLPLMSNDVASFWEYVVFFSKDIGYGNFVCTNDYRYCLNNVVKGMPFYGSEKEYYELKKRLFKLGFPNFVEMDVRSFSKVKSTYDLIYLSNIIDCMGFLEMRAYMNRFDYSQKERLENINCLEVESSIEQKLAKQICSEAVAKLRSNGKIMVDYRSNRTIKSSPDWLYNNAYFDVSLIDAKYFAEYPSKVVEQKDLMLTYTPSRTGTFW